MKKTLSTLFKSKHILAFVCILLSCSTLYSQVRILTIGDSTMADYNEEQEMRGWVQMLPVFLKDNVKLDNAARNGRSSKSFYFEFWEGLRETLKPGDYVFIQFGHNDEKNNGEDTDENDKTQRGTAAWGQYRKYLTKYVKESREKGAIPVLFTPVVRRYFNADNKITKKGLHNLAEFTTNDSLMNYPLVMRHIANELNVPLVDMTVLTENLVTQYGPEKSKEVLYSSKDNTHLKIMGGIWFSKLAVEDLLKQGILTDYLKLPHDLSYQSNKKQEISIPGNGQRLQLKWTSSINKKPSPQIHVTTEGLQFVTKKKNKLLTISGNIWSDGDIDMNSARYFELKILPQSSDFYINEVIIDAEAVGGSGMYCTVLGSVNPSFSGNNNAFITMQNLPVKHTSNFVIKINKGEAYYIRLYPWYNSASSEKFINLKLIEIKGILAE